MSKVCDSDRLGFLEGEILILFIIVTKTRTSQMLVEIMTSYLILYFRRVYILQQDEEKFKKGI